MAGRLSVIYFVTRTTCAARATPEVAAAETEAAAEVAEVRGEAAEGTLAGTEGETGAEGATGVAEGASSHNSNNYSSSGPTATPVGFMYTTATTVI